MSEPLSVLYLFCASVAAGISHAVSQTSINVPIALRDLSPETKQPSSPSDGRPTLPQCLTMGG